MKQAGESPATRSQFKGDNMRAYSSMTTSEFVSQLRDIAIKANARAQVIDQIDAIVEGPTEDEVTALEEAAYDKGFNDGYAERKAEEDQ